MAKNGGIDDAVVLVVLNEEDPLAVRAVRSHACPRTNGAGEPDGALGAVPVQQG
jgi:hypothetical protein